MRTIRLRISYDGTGYVGWQIQPNGPSIQQELTEAIERITGQRSIPVASGRTDAGVHALGQVAHFTTDSNLDADALVRALNANLSSQIVVHSAEAVDPSFDAVRHAINKHYRYVFHDGLVANVFMRQYCWKVRSRLDVGRVSEAARGLLGTHDFRCFETEWPNRASSVRTIRRCQATRLADFVYLDVEADGFLYNMVRAIAGTLREVGRGRWPPERIGRILESGDRSLAGPTAPAHGLFLVRVDYPPEILARPQ